MDKFETVDVAELSAVVGGKGGKRARRRKIANCAAAIGKETLKNGIRGGLAGTALGTPVGTVGGAVFGANIGIIRGSVSCVAGL